VSEPSGLASRRAAFEVLRRVHERGAWSTLVMPAVLVRSGLDTRDRAFAANLAYSTLRWEGTLDWALAQVVTRPLAQVEAPLLDVLRLGAWQILYGGTPDRAAVGTAVDLARAAVAPRTSGFVNGVLRGLARKRDALPWPDARTDEGLGLALGYPAWVAAEARRRFGDRAPAVLEAGNDPPGVTLRATGDREALIAELAAAGIDARPGRWAPEAVVAPGADPSALSAVAERRAIPQDEASMLVSRAAVAGVGPGARVLDACAAPGGKATHLAQLGMRVVAADVHPRRAGLIRGVPVAVADGLAPPWRPGSFDVVLVDAPCTGLGTVRRRPEVRWRRRPEDPRRLGDLQRALLSRLAPTVRPGGRLVYSACTWPLDETAAVAAGFLAEHGAAFTAVRPDLGGAGSRPSPDDPGLQLTPDADDTDGMYVAVFARG
jgi:16S rRNA (cytosine967-C5)-methyltransferase